MCGKIGAWQSTSLFLLCTSLSLLSTVHSLHLKMIHRDSIHSPLYPGNLTHEERLQRLHDYTEARSQLYHSKLMHSSYESEQIRPHIKGITTGYSYLVELTIGTPVRETYHVIMDTGSDLLWLQCEPCRYCWRQTPTIFDPQRQSRSYAPLPCDHRLCDLSKDGWSCINNHCHYKIVYAEPATTEGVVATKTFGFASDEGSQREFIRNLVFGCGNENRGFSVSSMVTGILGLNMDEASLARQMTAGRFGYCLKPFTDASQSPSLLKFGNEAIPRGANVKTLPFISVPESKSYYLGLVDVSVGSRRLGFHPGTFTVQKENGNYEGGFIIDSGATVTQFMKGGPYETIIEVFKIHFGAFNLARDHNPNFDLCYRYSSGFRAFPSMTLHFRDRIDLVVQPEYMVYKYSRHFCVMIHHMEDINILGAYQQQNYRFSYDLASSKLSFIPANCVRDP